jgi:hypothetical protein
MTSSTLRVRPGRAHSRALLAGLVLVALAGCGGADGPEQALDEIVPPSWFTEPRDSADPDADPPRWTRRYAALPAPTSDVEMVYAQALDRAGWRFHPGDCAAVGAPRGGALTADCWTRSGLVLGYVASPEGGAETPSRLEIVLHRAGPVEPSPSRA